MGLCWRPPDGCMSGLSTYDLVVVGAGSGGLATAKRATECGASVAIVEQAALGGTCSNRGCVPKKLLWASAEARWLAQRSGAAPAAAFDLEAHRRTREDHIADLRDGFEDDLTDRGVALFRGRARLTGIGKLDVDGRAVSARHVALATGATPNRPDMPGADHLSVSDDVFGWDGMPGTLVVLGGGYIGCEFAAIFAALGSDVTLVTHGDRLLTSFAPPLGEAAESHLEALGVALRFGTTLSRVAEADGALSAELEGGGTLPADRVLAAIGRTPRLDILNDLPDQPQRGESGALTVGERMQTTLPWLYAVGDCADRLPLTPVATTDGTFLAERLFGDASVTRTPLYRFASAAFVLPPVAQVGEMQGAERCDRTVSALEAVVRSDLPDTRIVKALDKAGRLKGLGLAGIGAHEMIGVLGWTLAEDGVSRPAIAVHPSFAEEIA